MPFHLHRSTYLLLLKLGSLQTTTTFFTIIYVFLITASYMHIVNQENAAMKLLLFKQTRFPPYRFNQKAYSSFEILSIRLSTRTFTLNLSAIYRPPNSPNFINQLSTLLNNMSSLTTPHIILGDFNYPKISNPSNPLSQLLSEHKMVQHINFPIHFLGNTLDLITLTSSKISNEHLFFQTKHLSLAISIL